MTIAEAIARAAAKRNDRSWVLRLERPWESYAPQPPIERAIEALVLVLAPHATRIVEAPHTLYDNGDGTALLFTFQGYSGNPRDYYCANEEFATIGRPLRVDGRIWADSFTDGGERMLGSSFEVNIDARRPWPEQAALRDALVAQFAPIGGFRDVTLTTTPTSLLHALAAAGEAELAARYTDEASRAIVADRLEAAARGESTVSLRDLPFLDHEALLSAIADPSHINFVALDGNELTRLPDALARFPILRWLSLLNNPALSDTEIDRIRRLLPPDCKIDR